MKILITGAAGFIGHKIARSLAARNHAVIALDDLSTGRLENLRNIRGLEFVRGDAAAPEDTIRAARSADLIIHMASVVGQLRVRANPELAYQVSANSTESLLAQAPRTPFVLFSSSAVYGLVDRGKCVETAQITDEMVLAYDGGRRSYAFGKWQAEKLVRASSGRPVLVVRPFNVVGSGQVSTYGMVIPRFVEGAMRRIPLPIFDDGEQARSFSHAETFVDSFMRLLERWLAGTIQEQVFNIGTPHVTTVNQLASVVEKTVGHAVQRQYQPFASVFPGKQDVRNRVPDTTRITAAIGPTRWPTIEDVVREIHRLQLSSHPDIQDDLSYPDLLAGQSIGRA